MRREPSVTKREAQIAAIVVECKRILMDPTLPTLNQDDVDIVLAEDGRTILAHAPDGSGGWVTASIEREGT